MTTAKKIQIAWFILPFPATISVFFKSGQGHTLALASLLIAFVISSMIFWRAGRTLCGEVNLRDFTRSKEFTALSIGAAALTFAAGVLASIAFATFVFIFVAGALGAIGLSVSTTDQLRRRTRGLLLALTVFCVTTALGEAALRFPLLANLTRPQSYVRQTTLLSPTYDAAARVTWNGRPFRSLHLGSERADDILRILVLGDSFTWGTMIERTEDTWPYVLERAINARGIPCEVISLAHRGDTTVNELEYLRKFGWDLEPDIVLTQYLINDPLPSGSNFQRESVGWMKARTQPLAGSFRLHAKLQSWSYFYSLANRAFAKLQRATLGLKDLNYHDLHRDKFPAWEDTKDAFAQFANDSQTHKTPIMFVMFPVFFPDSKLDNSYEWLSLHKKVQGEVHNAGMPFLDLLPIFAKGNPDASIWQVHPADVHPSVDAHRLAGESVLAELIELGWIDADK